MPRRRRTADVSPEPAVSAREAGLRYVNDSKPGIRRIRSSNGFRYIGPGRGPVRDRETLERVRRLAIPPAWTEVWICPIEKGHIQATGRDARERKQYRYHKAWREERDETKYSKMIVFAEALPRIRRRVARDLAQPGLPREKVLATLVRLLEMSHIRIGNDEYRRENRSFGLTTLRNRHVRVSGNSLRFHFRGKSGKQHEVAVEDSRVAKIVRRCQGIPGQELFEYIDESGSPRAVGSEDVNDYLREISGADFTAKDFRTWAGTVIAAVTLGGRQKFQSRAEAKKNISAAIKEVARQLGNTPAICRKCYIHPAIFNAYAERRILNRVGRGVHKPSRHGLHENEKAALSILREWSARSNESFASKLDKSIKQVSGRRNIHKTSWPKGV